MIKGVNKGVYSCISKNGTPKSRWDNQDEVIEKAKYLNKRYPKVDSKLVGYKCPNCHKYHLTTKFKNKKVW